MERAPKAVGKKPLCCRHSTLVQGCPGHLLHGQLVHGHLRLLPPRALGHREPFARTCPTGAFASLRLWGALRCLAAGVDPVLTVTLILLTDVTVLALAAHVHVGYVTKLLPQQQISVCCAPRSARCTALCPLHQSRFKRLYCARVGQSAALLNYMCGDEVGSAEVVQDRSGRLEVGSQHSGSGVVHFQSSGSGEVPIFCIGSPEVGSEGQVAMW